MAIKPKPAVPGVGLSPSMAIAAVALAAIVAHLLLRLFVGERIAVGTLQWSTAPLVFALVAGGIPLVWELIVKAVRLEFSSDLLAGISIVTALVLGEYLAGTLVVLMLSGGQALESFAVRHASSALEALASRM